MMTVKELITKLETADPNAYVGIHNSCYECDAFADNILTDVHTEGEYGQLKEYGCDDPNIGYYMLCHDNAKFVVIEG